MSKGRESKHNDFYVVRQSPPTSTPPNSLGLEDFTKQASKASNAYT